ncbi:MAG: malate dehydrogenase, partial [Okeania sp. SIO2D1]|nr:malate dehydrogenase [Okeania sp. SIO2D1]
IELHDCKIIGSNDFADTAGSDIVVITAGLPRRPGMDRNHLINTNAQIVAEAAKKAITHSPNALLVTVTNPPDVMTYLAWKATDLPVNRVMGMAGVLDSTRLQTFIALELGITVANVSAMVLGSHGDLMVPLPKYCTVSGIPITEMMEESTIKRLIERARHGGAEVVKLLKTGGAYYAPASSVCLMIESILLDQSRLLPVTAYLQGNYGMNDLFLGVPCRLGSKGIEQIIELELTMAERTALQVSADSVRENIQKALAFLEH